MVIGGASPTGVLPWEHGPDIGMLTGSSAGFDKGGGFVKLGWMPAG